MHHGNREKIVAVSLVVFCVVSYADDVHAFDIVFVSTQIALGTGLAVDEGTVNPNFHMHALVGPLLVTYSSPAVELVPEFGYALTVDYTLGDEWRFQHLAVGGMAFGIHVGRGVFTELFVHALVGGSSGDTMYGVRSGARVEWMTMAGLEVAYQWLGGDQGSHELQLLLTFDLCGGGYLVADFVTGTWQ